VCARTLTTADPATIIDREIKDFRGVAIENKQRQLQELPLEIGLKARDTVAGLLGWSRSASRTSFRCGGFEPFTGSVSWFAW
jgi:hypothetical protein